MNKIILKLLLISSLSSILNLPAQKRISYSLQILYPEALKKNFIVYLDINTDHVDFYDAKFKDPREKASGMVQYITRKNGSKENTMFLQDFNSNYFRIKTTDMINWKLSDDYKTVDQYKLQKATTEFGGREWIVWFCNEIPLTEGPYKFNGLPGLIFEAEDTSGVFKYTLLKTESLTKNAILEAFKNKNIPDTTWEKYNKLLLNFYENPFQKERESVQKGYEIAYDDKEMKVQDFSAKTKEFQERVKKNLPPLVESDKNVFQNIKNQK